MTNFSTNNNDVSNWAIQRAKQATISEKEIMIDSLIDQIHDKLRAMVYLWKQLLHSRNFALERKDVFWPTLISAEYGKRLHVEWCLCIWSAWHVFKKITFIGVLTKVHRLISCHLDDIVLKFKKSRRRLKLFVNSLFIDAPDTPSIRDIFSWNVMTPYIKVSNIVHIYLCL